MLGINGGHKWPFTALHYLQKTRKNFSHLTSLSTPTSIYSFAYRYIRHYSPVKPTLRTSHLAFYFLFLPGCWYIRLDINIWSTNWLNGVHSHKGSMCLNRQIDEWSICYIYSQFEVVQRQLWLNRPILAWQSLTHMLHIREHCSCLVAATIFSFAFLSHNSVMFFPLQRWCLWVMSITKHNGLQLSSLTEPH